MKGLDEWLKLSVDTADGSLTWRDDGSTMAMAQLQMGDTRFYEVNHLFFDLIGLFGFDLHF